jgi:hypothetical protein
VSVFCIAGALLKYISRIKMDKPHILAYAAETGFAIKRASFL